MTGGDLLIKATATGITFLQDRRYRNRYNGSKTCAVGINGEIWPKKSDYVLMQKLKVPSRLISYSVEGLHYLDNEKYIDAITPKRKTKKKAGSPACFNIDNEVPPPIEDASCENSRKSQKKRDYKINKREVRQRILSYINTQKGKKELYFWTVTFPDGTPDDVCYQSFNTWLTTLRHKQRVKTGKAMPAILHEYLWIAERQMGDRLTTDKKPTYTIHFHIAIPHYMPVTKANSAMRTILKNLAKKGEMPGCVCNTKTREPYYLPSIARYNGVHISRDRAGKIINFSIKRASKVLANYLTKYITKNDAGIADENGNVEIPGFTHLAWHNSRGFSCLFTSVAFSIAEFKQFGFGPYLNRLRRFDMPFATFVPWLMGPPPLLMDHLFHLNSYIQIILDEPQSILPA